ncbi:MAG: dTMP kinase [Rhodoferax sp.]|nr:dTMP kinase [Rhodoferax sp.]
MNGLFVSFEGIDGAGKSTHIQAMADAFTAQGRNVTLTREPGGTPLAEKLRAMVLQDSMDAMTEALLVFAARRDHVQRVILPALEQGDVVLCDRFSDATFAYQGGGRGFDWEVLSQLERWVQGTAEGRLIRPDVTVWFDLPPEIAAARLSGARSPDKFESQPRAFFEKVAAGYARRLAEDGGRFVRINAHQTPAEVWADLLVALQDCDLLPRNAA